MRNKLRCLFQCEEYIWEMNRRIFAYNRMACGKDFDTEEIYEHGKKVYGSGWNKEDD